MHLGTVSVARPVFQPFHRCCLGVSNGAAIAVTSRRRWKAGDINGTPTPTNIDVRSGGLIYSISYQF
jgi:hypothetical protein